MKGYSEEQDYVVPVGDDEPRPVKITGRLVAVVEYTPRTGGMIKEQLFRLTDGSYVAWRYNVVTGQRRVAHVTEEQLRSGEKYPLLATAAGLIEPMPLDEWLRRFQS